WQDNRFEFITSKSMGVHIQLGHWCGPEHRCLVPNTAPDDDFVINDSHGIHEVGLDFCGCRQGGLPIVQLLRAGTTMNPRTAAMFAVLRHKRRGVPVSDFESGWIIGLLSGQNHYQEFLRMTGKWCHIQLLKRVAHGHNPGGIAATTLLCPACPQLGAQVGRSSGRERVSLQAHSWKFMTLMSSRFLHALFLTMDVNFRLKHKNILMEEKDPGLGRDGCSIPLCGSRHGR
ncbi:hypothetical protein C8R43DRAFT_875840, partial [Mycena crocata]